MIPYYIITVFYSTILFLNTHWNYTFRNVKAFLLILYVLFLVRVYS